MSAEADAIDLVDQGFCFVSSTASTQGFRFCENDSSNAAQRSERRREENLEALRSVVGRRCRLLRRVTRVRRCNEASKQIPMYFKVPHLTPYMDVR